MISFNAMRARLAVRRPSGATAAACLRPAGRPVATNVRDV
jgi:hypothetical protein